MTKKIVTVGIISFLCAFIPFSSTHGETLWEKLQQGKKRTTKIQTPDGKTHESTIVTDNASRGTLNEDGSLTIEGANAVETGKHGTFRQESQSNFKKNEDGSFQWNSRKQVENDKNPWGWKTKTSGSSQKTNDGSAWSNTRVVTDLQGRETKIDSKGRWVKNPDGTWTHIVQKTNTLPDGTVTTEQEETVFKHSPEDGLQWNKTTNKDNPWGKSTVSETGGASLGKDGLKWKADKEGTNPWGKKWSSQSSGEGKAGKDGTSWKDNHSAQTEDGKWKWKWGQKNKTTKDEDGNVTSESKVDGDVSGSKGEKFKAWLESLKKKKQ